ncbi:hypothetical protein [Streptomyces sp. DSM 40907]|uniref:hypothetical protein n=1 Tax=Streptomyces kutzneri TaxID=3051179 RepID=UPI0028D24923|nr:hypothetical protein [Streptomyces sp. DSM 40907]
MGLLARSWRWFTAAGVTVVAFAAPTVVCGLWVLPSVIQDPGTRWAVASALGAAVAALAVLWGQSFAASPTTAAAPPPPATVIASGDRAFAVEGDVEGNITTGNRGGPAVPPAGWQPPAAPGSAALVPPGSVVASGDRAAAFRGKVKGDVTTGDQPGGPTP